MTNNELISIIIPVYNAEKTLPRCIASLFAQTYGKVELLFVNDCCTDNSLTVIDEAIAYATHTAGIEVKILHHETNRGVAAARNTGLEAATGTYIYYVDADDWIESDAMECLVQEAEQKNADIVGYDWYLSFEKNERYMKQPVFTTPDDALRKLMGGVMRWNLWLFMVRRSLYENNGIRFIEGLNMGEDMMVMIKLFASAKTVAILNKPFYHYVPNAQSLTRVYSPDHIRQVTANVQEVENYIAGSGLYEQLKPYVHFLKLNIKLPLLISDSEARYNQWSGWFFESNAYVMQNKLLPLRTRLIQWMATKKYWVFVKFYYRFVIKFIYGVIYK
ncbi:MAG: glycosyltransferase [Tannerella sp.]|jgi:glycosyltransferase involved in cell wall biosynthesis|nr:glycosyltransferase [Tannerella sp.]